MLLIISVTAKGNKENAIYLCWKDENWWDKLFRDIIMEKCEVWTAEKKCLFLLNQIGLSASAQVRATEILQYYAQNCRR